MVLELINELLAEAHRGVKDNVFKPGDKVFVMAPGSRAYTWFKMRGTVVSVSPTSAKVKTHEGIDDYQLEDEVIPRIAPYKANEDWDIGRIEVDRADRRAELE